MPTPSDPQTILSYLEESELGCWQRSVDHLPVPASEALLMHIESYENENLVYLEQYQAYLHYFMDKICSDDAQRLPPDIHSKLKTKLQGEVILSKEFFLSDPTKAGAICGYIKNVDLLVAILRFSSLSISDENWGRNSLSDYLCKAVVTEDYDNVSWDSRYHSNPVREVVRASVDAAYHQFAIFFNEHILSTPIPLAHIARRHVDIPLLKKIVEISPNMIFSLIDYYQKCQWFNSKADNKQVLEIFFQYPVHFSQALLNDRGSDEYTFYGTIRLCQKLLDDEAANKQALLNSQKLLTRHRNLCKESLYQDFQDKIRQKLSTVETDLQEDSINVALST